MNINLAFTILFGCLLLALLLLVSFYAIKMFRQYAGRIIKQVNSSHEELSRQIKSAVEPKFIDISPSTQSLVEAAIEVWRLEKRVRKVSDDLSDDQNKAFENSISKLVRFLEKSDVTFVDYTDQKYNEGLNLDVLSIEKDESISDSIIKETHEPAVFHRGQLIKKAKVVVLEK